MMKAAPRWHDSDLLLVSLFVLALTTYIPLAPVFWLPGVPPEALSLFKGGIAFASIALGLFLSARTGGGKWLIVPAILVLFSALGLLQSSSEEAFAYVLASFLPFLFLLCGIVMGLSGKSVAYFFRAVIIATACLAVAHLVATALGLSQGEAEAASDGFGLARTGWSNGLAFAAAASAWLALTSQGKQRILLWAACASIVMSQATVGGRAGILCPVAAVLLCGFALPTGDRINKGRLFVIILIGSVLAYFLWDNVEELLRLRRQTGQYQDGLDAFSSGRVAGYRLAWQLILERPIFGYGFNAFQDSGLWGDSFVHNVWLKLLYQGGVVLLVSWVAVVLWILKSTVSVSRVAPGAPYAPVLFTGVFLTFFEPNVLVGSAQTSAFWWLVAGLSVAARSSWGLEPSHARSAATRDAGPFRT